MHMTMLMRKMGTAAEVCDLHVPALLIHAQAGTSPAGLDFNPPASGKVGVRLRQYQVCSHIVCTACNIQNQAHRDKTKYISQSSSTAFKLALIGELTAGPRGISQHMPISIEYKVQQ